MKIIIHTGYTHLLSASIPQFPDHLHWELQRKYFVNACKNDELVVFKTNSNVLQCFVNLSIQRQGLSIPFSEADKEKYALNITGWEVYEHNNIKDATDVLYWHSGFGGKGVVVMPDGSLTNSALRKLNEEFDSLLELEESDRKCARCKEKPPKRGNRYCSGCIEQMQQYIKDRK